MAITFPNSTEHHYEVPQLNRAPVVLPKDVYTATDIWSVKKIIDPQLHRFFSGISIHDADLFADNPLDETYRDSPYHGVFLIQRERPTHMRFLEKCREESSAFNRTLDDELRKRKLPLSCRRNPTGMRSDMIRLWISLDPPFLTTIRKAIGQEARSRAMSEKEIFCHIHRDERNTVSGVRMHKPRREGERLTELRRIIGNSLINYRDTPLFKENCGDWEALTTPIVTSIEEYFCEIDAEDERDRSGSIDSQGRKKIQTVSELAEEWNRDIEGDSLYSQKYALYLLLSHHVTHGLTRGSARENDLISDILSLAQDPVTQRQLDISITEQVLRTMLVTLYKR